MLVGGPISFFHFCESHALFETHPYSRDQQGPTGIPGLSRLAIDHMTAPYGMNLFMRQDTKVRIPDHGTI